jgi:hypothetical protein
MEGGGLCCWSYCSEGPASSHSAGTLHREPFPTLTGTKGGDRFGLLHFLFLGDEGEPAQTCPPRVVTELRICPWVLLRGVFWPLCCVVSLSQSVTGLDSGVRSYSFLFLFPTHAVSRAGAFWVTELSEQPILGPNPLKRPQVDPHSPQVALLARRRGSG